MADDIFKIDSSGLPDGALVVGFRGSEGISRPYVFELFLNVVSSEESPFDLADAVNAKATLTIDRQDGKAPFLFNGIFSELENIHEMDGRAIVRAVMVPKLWHLIQTQHSRIFTKQSIPDIITAILKDNGLSPSDFQLNLSGSYDTEEHVCQYRESDFNFISRWLEREGMYYFFEQSDSEEKLIIADAKSAHTPLDADPILFRSRVGHDVSAGECLHRFVCRQKALPADIKVRDYDFNKPDLAVTGSAPVSKSGLGEINTYGARFFTPDAGKHLAQTRAEDFLAREIVFSASGTTRYLRAGYLFTLQDHPRSSYDAKYLATEVEHYGSNRSTTGELRELTGLESDEVYRVEVTAIPSQTQFRSGEKTPWPRIYGTENAIVDGEASSPYAQIDDGGCYLVRVSFDENTLADGKASTRVRMMQPHGGAIEGHHFPLRKGTEVMLTFVGGDPDRPFIAGVVPNATKPSVIGSRNNTQNIIRTGGKNQIVMEDEAGKEFVFISTPNSQTGIYMGHPAGEQSKIYTGDGEEQTKGMTKPSAATPGGQETDTTPVSFSRYDTTIKNAGMFVGGDYWVNVFQTQNWFVDGDVATGYNAKYTLDVGGDTIDHYYATRVETVDTGHTYKVAGAGRDDDISGGWKQKVAGGWTQSSITGGWTQTTISGGWKQPAIGGGWTQKISAGWTQAIDGGWTQSSISGGWKQPAITGGWTQTVDTWTCHATGAVTWNFDSGVTLTGPTLTTVGATWKQQGASDWDVKNMKLGAYLFAFTDTVVKTELTGIAVGVTGLKMDMSSIAVKIGIAKIENKAADIGSGGFLGKLMAFISFA